MMTGATGDGLGLIDSLWDTYNGLNGDNPDQTDTGQTDTGQTDIDFSVTYMLPDGTLSFEGTGTYGSSDDGTGNPWLDPWFMDPYDNTGSPWFPGQYY